MCVLRICLVRSVPPLGGSRHGGIRYGALSSQRSHSNAYAVLSPLAATLLMAQTQSIIVTCTGFHAFGTRSRVNAAVNEIQHCDVTVPLG